MKQLGLSTELIVDSFAGGGGASTGIEQALGHPVHIAINHDGEAVSMHAANHPYTQHYCEDVFKVDPEAVEPHRPIGLLWASPDCTHHSKARGGKPVSKRRRGLAWVVIHWAAARKPRVIMLENVEEFVSWGPLRTARNTGKKMRGTPSQKRKAETFNQFVSALRGLGYKVEWKEMRACDYGAPTIRKRFFLVARCDGQPIVWPQPTHGKPGSGLLPHRTAAEIIDWSLPCPSIFDRKRPLADNTMRRIARGIEKYVINSPSPFIVECANASSTNGTASLDNPMRTITAQTKGGTFALITPVIEVHHGQSDCTRVDAPLGCILGKQKHALVCPTLVQVGYGEREGQAPRVPGLYKPLGTVVAGGQKHALISAFLAKHYGGVVGTGVDVPTGTVTTTDHHSLVTAHIMKMRGENIGHGTDEPLHTISAGGTHFAEVRAFLIKYFGTDQDPRIDEPLHTVTTKDRFGLVTVHGEDYQIVDIGMRMLSPRELYRAQGFPDNYIIDRTADGKPLSKVAQVRMCGNSVSPVMSRALVAANINESILYERPRIAA